MKNRIELLIEEYQQKFSDSDNVVSFETMRETTEILRTLISSDSALAALAEPMGLALVPVSTNGEIKAICIGEHTIPIDVGCSECGDFHDEDCDMCEGQGEYVENKVIPWTIQKDIYHEIVEAGRIKPKQAEKGKNDE